MSLIKEFREFASRGNVVDMAVGVILGGAFGKIVSSLVNDVVMPPIGALMGGIDFGNLALTVKAASGGDPEVTIKYGAFVNTVIDFFIVSLVIFLVIHLVSKLRKKQVEAPAKPAEPTKQEVHVHPAGLAADQAVPDVHLERRLHWGQ